MLRKGFEELRSSAKDKGGTNKRKQALSIKLMKLHYCGLCLFINDSCSMEKISNSPKSNNRPVGDSGQLFESLRSKFCDYTLL